MQRVVLDTDALVALLDRKDQHHPWATEAFRFVGVPMATCDAVLSETWFLLNRLPQSLEVLHRWIRRGWLVNRFDFETMGTRAFDLMARYRDLPMSYADACLVIVAEELQAHSIFTVDSHFQIYRRHGDQPVPLLSPFAA